MPTIRSRALIAVAALLLSGAGLSACTGTDAGLITVTGPSGIAASLVVQIGSHDGKHSSNFTVPATEGAPLTLPKTIAITFPSSVVGYLDVHVDGTLGGKVVAAGDGFSTTPVVKGGVTQIAVELTATGPVVGPDGGAAMDLASHD